MVDKTILDCGLVVISEYRPEFPSIALSYSLRSGSRAETRENNGIHHFMEHMVFKGSRYYDLSMIADVSDRLGGSLNAFTGKEITQYYLKAIKGKLAESFDLLTDIVTRSLFLESEFLKEKGVVLQEINEAYDDPETFVFERFYEMLFGDNGLAFPIPGEEDRVAEFTRDMLFDFYRDQYLPPQLLLAAVGDVEHDELVELANRAFSGYAQCKPGDFSFSRPDFSWRTLAKRNSSLSQLYVILGFRAIPAASPEKFQYMMLNDILGSGMSSRLFQEIREQKGLAYTVNSFVDAYLDCGIQLVYAIIDPKKRHQYLKAVKKEILNLKNKGITAEELARSKDHMKASIILGLEGNLSKMRFNVNQEFFLKRELAMAEIVAGVERVTVDEINDLYTHYLDVSETALFLYGKVPEKEFREFNFADY